MVGEDGRAMVNLFTQARAKAQAANGAPTDYKEWLCAMFPEHFRGVDQFAPHHEDYWQHVWGIEKGVRPKPGVAAWNRRGMKSTAAEATGPTLAALGKRHFGLYISSTQKKADGHLETVKDMLVGSRLRDYYPSLAKPEIKLINDRKVPGAWNHAELSAGDDISSGLYMIAIGLNVSVRGLKRYSLRPGFELYDDIEDENDSFYVVQDKIERIKAGILSAGSEDLAVFIIQNLIHRDSVVSQILDGRADMLRGHRVFGGAPVPALRDKPTYKEEGTGPSKHYFILSGTPSWVGFDLKACEAELNTVGKRTWELEYQHNVKLPYLDAIFPGFNEIHHVITWSEFARVYRNHGAVDHMGRPRLPQRGHAACSFDQGTTIGHPSVCLWDWQPAEEMPKPSDLFYYREGCWPSFPLRGEFQPVVPEDVGMAIQDAEREWNEQIKWRQGSHEAQAVRNSFGYFLGRLPGYKNIHFDPINTKQKKHGIVGIQDFLGVDLAKPSQFRIDPRTLDGDERWCEVCLSIHAGSHLSGDTSIHFIVPDEQGELYVDANGELAVLPAMDQTGFARTRWEFPKYRHPRTAQGVEQETTPKIDDDAMDCLIASVARRLLKPESKTEDMRIDERMPEKFRKENITPERQNDPYFEMNRYTARAAVQHQIQQEQAKDWRGDIRRKLRSRPRIGG
jgi:hypothetical protein